MNKIRISKILILLITTVLSVGNSYADTEAEQPVLLTVQPAVTITKTENCSENGSIDPEHDGAIVGTLISQFMLGTNETDDTCDFIVTSKVKSESGMVSGYGNNGSNVWILFSNTDRVPTDEAVANAKIGGSDNDNVIAYPVAVSIT